MYVTNILDHYSSPIHITKLLQKVLELWRANVFGTNSTKGDNEEIKEVRVNILVREVPTYLSNIITLCQTVFKLAAHKTGRRKLWTDEKIGRRYRPLLHVKWVQFI